MGKSVLIGISGGSASGKTTLAKKIALHFKGVSTVISLDNYYKEYNDPDIDKKSINFDEPSSLDIPLFIEHLRRLKAGKDTEIPQYNFCTYSREPEKTLVKATKLIVVEGLFLFNIGVPEHTFNLKLFVDAPDDIRFIRRLERDVHQRARSLDSIVGQYLKTVRPMHYAHVLPNKDLAQVTYNTSTSTETPFNNLIDLVRELVAL